MKIEFDEDQYHLLLKVLYWSEWMVNSYKSEMDDEGRAVQVLEQQIFSYAKDAGMEDLIAYDVESKMYYPSADFEMAAHSRLEQYEEYILSKDKLN